MLSKRQEKIEVFDDLVSTDNTILARVRAGIDAYTVYVEALALAVMSGKTVEYEFNGKMYRTASL